ncbi:MAG: acpS [Acidimicrobiaceae bacterium]|nr:acpS [Acidimicrobiaceae bacterium]
MCEGRLGEAPGRAPDLELLVEAVVRPLRLVAGPQQIRVGVDVVRVADVARSISTLGARYLERVFTADELAECGLPGGWAVERLAARYAAKEALIKVLEPTGAQPEWRDIAVRRRSSGACELVLSGEALRQAELAGVARLSLSMTHEGEYAAAVVVGWDTIAVVAVPDSPMLHDAPMIPVLDVRSYEERDNDGRANPRGAGTARPNAG